MYEEWNAVVCHDEKIDGLRAAMARDAERLVSALRAGHLGTVASLSQQLVSTARQQFEAEERRLREAGSPTLVRHAREHQRFLADLGAMAALAARGDLRDVAALRPEQWIPAWLAAHARTDGGLPV